MLMSDYSVVLKNLNKIYNNLLKDDTVALENVNLEIEQSEFISIIGPSGCGKSTLLRIVGNLDKATSGTIEYKDGVDQQLGFVFQDSVLLPWKNVRENAEFPLVIQKKQTKENEEKLDELLELAGLTEFKTALPRELSGGMKQRVSIVRALSYDAPLMLMDEPFGALDALTRDHLNEELLKIWQKTKKTIIFVTHSIEEAAFLSDRVVVMSPRPGRIKEIVKIDLPRPRGEATRNDPKFTEYSKYLRGIIG
jgi:ABC-type nitrate/sulfonate/bicarbonate transport system, ATPase component